MTYKTMEDEGSVPTAAQAIINAHKQAINKPLNFYSYGIELNLDQQPRIFNNHYNRLLELELVDQIELYDGLMGEVSTQRALSKTFKHTEEQSLKKILEIQIKYSMCVEDRKSDKISFDKRVNQLIRDFVKIYK